MLVSQKTVARPEAEPGDHAAEVAEQQDGHRGSNRTTEGLHETLNRLKLLLAGKLPLDVKPQTLFDVSLDDESAVALETERLALLGLNSSLGEQAAHKRPGSTPSPLSEQLTLRLEVDSARLTFYQLPSEERSRLLGDHAARVEEQAKIIAREAEKQSEAEREAAEAEKKKAEALAAAKNARTEAERAIHAELARLLGVAKAQAEFEESLDQARAAAVRHHDSALKLRRELGVELRERESGEGSTSPLDVKYARLRERLRVARDDLGRAIVTMGYGRSQVPLAGENRLSLVPDEFDKSKVLSQRDRLAQRAQELSEKEDKHRQEVSRLLMNEVEMLNTHRLRLIRHLSSGKRTRIQGFTEDGLDQARSELRQVVLTVRYHLHATKKWAKAVRGGQNRTESALTATVIALKWLIPIAIFLWWRRRSVPLLTSQVTAAQQDARQRVGQVAVGNWAAMGWSLLLRVHRPLEHLLLLWSVFYLLPHSIQRLLEVDLLATILSWAFGGTLAVAAIDGLSSSRTYHQPGVVAPEAPQLRFQSLRLVGRTVATFGLILAITSKLVGQGTVYSWVFSSCWIAAFPVFLVIVAWWKPEIFQRLERVRKKSVVETWVLARRQGAASFLAAIVGSVVLFTSGVNRTLRAWLVTFTLVRRVLAYMFRRGMHRKGGEGEVSLLSLSQQDYRTLGPAQRSAEVVPSVADAQVDAVISRIHARGGGVFAIVGERGAGKTTTLERISGGDERITYLECPAGGVEKFKTALNAALELPASSEFAQAADELERVEDSAVLLDDSHHLIEPRLGGLEAFDDVLDLARATSLRCTWVFAVDQSLWRFLERARGSRPLFDDVIHLAAWSEPSIAKLLTTRTSLLERKASFQNLLVDLPTDADDVDIQEALDRTEAAYYRLLWDYADGNPGVALHFWRESLGVDSEGHLVVKLFEGPQIDSLETLPDLAVFVLRASSSSGLLPQSRLGEQRRYRQLK